MTRSINSDVPGVTNAEEEEEEEGEEEEGEEEEGEEEERFDADHEHQRSLVFMTEFRGHGDSSGAVFDGRRPRGHGVRSIAQ